MIFAIIVLSLVVVALAALVYFTTRDARSLRNDLSAVENGRAEAEKGLAIAESQLRLMRDEAARAASRLDEARKQSADLQGEISRLSERLRHAEADAAVREKQLADERARLTREAEDRFNNLANKILEENSRKFKEANESRLAEILSPLRDNIDQFKKTVTDTYSTESRERFSLEAKIKELIELNRSIGKEAKDLTEALKGNSKIQGDWGEMILESILEKSGLKKDVQFKVQQTIDDSGNVIRDTQGRALRPDVVVYYPDGRCVVIDSKVSLTAYVNWSTAETDDDRRRAGDLHLASVKGHIKELADKNYQDFVGDKKTDFVMMFIPNEAAYMLAMNLDCNLWQEAYDRRVLVISPTHLISALRLVEQLWRQDDMKRNVLEIAAEGGKMYDKFVAFLDNMAQIQKALKSTQDAYDDAMKKLRDGTGNLIKRAEDMRRLGAKASKKMNVKFLPEEDSDIE